MGYEDPTDLPDPSETPIYLLGWCQTRQAARTFRLDRMEPCKGSWDYQSQYNLQSPISNL